MLIWSGENKSTTIPRLNDSNTNAATSESLSPLGATMSEIKQYDIFILSKDINPNITKGMRGVILDVWTDETFEAEFVKENGTNYGFEGSFTFTIDKSYIEKIVDR